MTFANGVHEGLQRAIDLLRTHHEVVSNKEPFRFLSHRRDVPDLTNAAFIERLEEMRDAIRER